MTNDESNPKSEGRRQQATGAWFAYRASGFFRISSFGFRHYPALPGAGGWQPSPEASSARMKFAVNFAQPVSSHVRVNLRRRDARVTEQFLNHAQVRAVIEQVCGETVPQHVRRDISCNARQAHAALDAQPKCDGGEWGAAF